MKCVVNLFYNGINYGFYEATKINERFYWKESTGTSDRVLYIYKRRCLYLSKIYPSSGLQELIVSNLAHLYTMCFEIKKQDIKNIK